MLTSPLAGLVEKDEAEFAEAVRGFVDALGADRVHFGTDDPAWPKEE